MAYDRQISLTNYIVQRQKLSERETMVLCALCELGKGTSWEILDHMACDDRYNMPVGNNPNFVRPRLTDLAKKELVEKHKQITKNGVTQWIWMPTL